MKVSLCECYLITVLIVRKREFVSIIVVKVFCSVGSVEGFYLYGVYAGWGFITDSNETTMVQSFLSIWGLFLF